MKLFTVSCVSNWLCFLLWKQTFYVVFGRNEVNLENANVGTFSILNIYVTCIATRAFKSFNDTFLQKNIQNKNDIIGVR